MLLGSSSLLSVVKSAVARVVSGTSLITAAIGGTGEGSAGTDAVGDGAASIASAETSDCAELGITVSVDNLATAILDAALGLVVEFVEVTISSSNAAVPLNISGIVSIVGDITLVVDELTARVVVVGTVVPGTEVVSPAAIAEVGTVGIAVGVRSWGVAEGVSAETDGVANVARGVLVALVAEASLLLAEVVVVVTGDGVEGDVDLAGVVAPLVINGFLGIPMVVGAPLVPGVVDPLVVALALVADLTVGVVCISDVPLLLAEATTKGTATLAIAAEVTSAANETSTSAEATSSSEVASVATVAIAGIGVAEAVTFTVLVAVREAITVVTAALVTVLLVVRTISLGLDAVVVGPLPGLSGNDGSGEKNSLEHF